MWVFFSFFCVAGARDDVSIFDFSTEEKKTESLLINTQNIIEKNERWATMTDAQRIKRILRFH